MKTNRKKTIKLFVLALILLLGIGFAALAANLKITGTLNVSRTSWDVHFENVQITEGSVTANPAPTTNNIDTTEMTYTINFTKPGDYFEFTTDIVNDGTIDAMIDTVSNNAYQTAASTTPISLPTYLTSTVTYANNGTIKQNQELLHGTSETMKVRIEFKKDITVSDLPSSGDTTVVFKFIGDFKQKDETSINRYTCRRATQLHTAQCKSEENYGCKAAGYAENAEITYGTLGTKGNRPNSGDAFDCDVDGDGEFDSNIERFYYVSDAWTDKVFHDDVAVLIAANNFNGNEVTYEGFEYDKDRTKSGPVTLINYLPTTSQWKNVKLELGSIQNIYPQLTNTNTPPSVANFDFTGYAARPLRYKEFKNIPGYQYSTTEGNLDNYTWLLENSKFNNKDYVNYWLLEPYDGDYSATYINTYKRKPMAYYTDSLYGVRPAIEVKYGDIDY